MKTNQNKSNSTLSTPHHVDRDMIKLKSISTNLNTQVQTATNNIGFSSKKDNQLLYSSSVLSLCHLELQEEFKFKVYNEIFITSYIGYEFKTLNEISYDLQQIAFNYQLINARYQI